MVSTKMVQLSKSEKEELSGLPVRYPNMDVRQRLDIALEEKDVAILPPMDVMDSLNLMETVGLSPKVTILDPWYNKGYGGVRDDYEDRIIEMLAAAAKLSEHIFLWGFPEIIARFVDKLPAPFTLVAWLTWYYKNNPSVIRGWRSSQNACLHLARPEAKLYPEHFLNAAQKEKMIQGKLRYMPGPTSVIEAPLDIAGNEQCYGEGCPYGPTSVIEAPLNIGFVGKKEQTGHPAQKPVTVFERIILMATEVGDVVYDPMSGSGTTGEAAKKNGRLAILSDISEDYTQIAERRLGVSRVTI